MSDLESELSLEPISPDQPCGPNLQYDADFIELERVAQGKPEQQYGDTIIPAEDPDWKQVKRVALDLQRRTKDLRVACHLARAAVDIDGLAGFCKCLAAVRGYVDLYWETVHPQLDPDDDNDPTERVNVVASLADKHSTVAQLLGTPIVRSMLGNFSMRDIMVARGEVPVLGDQPPTDMAAIEGAFLNCGLDVLQQSAATAKQGYDDAVAIEDLITQKAGTTNAVSMELLSSTLKMIHDYVERQLGMRDSDQSSYEDAADSEGSGISAEGAAPTPAGQQAISGEIRSREDVLRTIDKICDYYDRNEPSSPLPMLLKRAKRLATKSFLDILEDLTPEGLSQARIIGGLEGGQSEE